jgi:hypothetical protein
MISRPFAELLEDGRLAIHATKALYILTPGEVLALLPSCRSLWVVAARRGKAHRRAEDAARRAGHSTALEVMEGGCTTP